MVSQESIKIVEEYLNTLNALPFQFIAEILAILHVFITSEVGYLLVMILHMVLIVMFCFVMLRAMKRIFIWVLYMQYKSKDMPWFPRQHRNRRISNE